MLGDVIVLEKERLGEGSSRRFKGLSEKIVYLWASFIAFAISFDGPTL